MFKIIFYVIARIKLTYKHRHKYLCRKWKQCVVLTWNQEYVLCGNKKCTLTSFNGITRAYKKALEKDIAK